MKKTVDVLIETQEFVDKYCITKPYINEYFWKTDHNKMINKSLVGNGILGCKMIGGRLLQTPDGFKFDWKFVKEELNEKDNPEYYI